MMRDTYFMPKRNRVTVKCEQCSAELSKPPSLVSKRNFCDQRCMGLYRRVHPTNDASQMHTSEVHEKIRQAHLTNPLSGEKNGMFGRHHSEEARTRMSEKRTQAIVEGRFRPYGTQNKKGVYVSTKTGVSMFFKSSWEEATMKHLDVDPNIATYEYEKLRIPYTYDNHKRWYVPDFVITFTDDTRVVWEVKPEQFLQTERVLRTIEAGLQYCEQNGMQYQVLTGRVLKEKGIIP